MKIQIKVLLSFLFILIIFGIAGGITHSALQELSILQKEMITNSEISHEAAHAAIGAQMIHTGVLISVVEDPVKGRNLIAKGEEEMENSQGALEKLVTDPAMREVAEEIEMLEVNLYASRSDFLEILQEDKSRNTDDISSVRADLDEQLDLFTRKQMDLEEMAHLKLIKATDTVTVNSEIIRGTIISSIIIALIITLILAFFLSSAITKPIVHLTNAAEKVSMGDLDQEIKVQTNDEIQNLADSFIRMIKAFKVMQAMADEAESGETK